MSSEWFWRAAFGVEMTLERDGATELLQTQRRYVRGLVLEIGVGGNRYTAENDRAVTLDVNPAVRPDVIGDAHALPFRSGTFDSVVSSQVFEHLHSPWVAAGEVSRVAAHDGTLLLAVPFLYWLHATPNDYFRYTEFGIRRLFEDDFEIESMQPYGGRVAVLFDVSFVTTASSSVVRKALHALRKHGGSARRVSRFRRWLVFHAPSRAEMPLGYVMRARRRGPEV